jgi:hypothetical protein
MLSISQSLTQRLEVNCGPRSEVIVSGTPKREIQVNVKALCACRCGRLRKGNSFHPLGCAINNGENIIEIITILQWAQQIHMKVRKTPLWDGEGLGGQACMAVDLGPLAGQALTGPGGDVAG